MLPGVLKRNNRNPDPGRQSAEDPWALLPLQPGTLLPSPRSQHPSHGHSIQGPGMAEAPSTGPFASAPLPRRKCSASGPPTCLGLLPHLATSCRGCGSQLRRHPRGCPPSQQLPRPSKATLPSPVGGCSPASSSDARPGSPTGLSAPGGQGLRRSCLSLDSWASAEQTLPGKTLTKESRFPLRNDPMFLVAISDSKS